MRISEDGLSKHDIGMIGGTIVLAIIGAFGMLFLGWHLRDLLVTALVWVGIGAWGYACERAENTERRLKRIEEKLDKALGHLRDIRETVEELKSTSKRGEARAEAMEILDRMSDRFEKLNHSDPQSTVSESAEGDS